MAHLSSIERLPPEILAVVHEAIREGAAVEGPVGVRIRAAQAARKAREE